MVEWRGARKRPVMIEYREVEPVVSFFDTRTGSVVKGEIIETREGTLYARCGLDFIIKGTHDEVYPIEKVIFFETFDVL